MDFLARREHSCFELKQKLLLKFPELVLEDLERVLLQLQAENLQSDKRFTESYIRYRKSRGFGYRHIRADLSSRRVHPDIISKYLFNDDEDWKEIALDLVARKIELGADFEFGSKQHQKLVRFMEARGFAINEIQKALDKSVNIIPSKKN